MAEHVSYWTIRRQINANVDRHIASLESEQQIHVDFDESFFKKIGGILLKIWHKMSIELILELIHNQICL